MTRKVLELTRRQQVTIIEEFWSVHFNGVPNMSASSMAIDNWIEERYNCKLFRPSVMMVCMNFETEQDVTFFLLNHP